MSSITDGEKYFFAEALNAMPLDYDPNKSILKKSINDQIQDEMDIRSEVLREYNDNLVQRGIAMTRKDLKQKNIIDLREICTYNKQTGVDDKNKIPDISGKNITDEFLYNNYWYAYIPCFNEGVLQLNASRYFYWKIRELNTTNRTMQIYVCDYSRINNIWQMGTHIDVTYHFESEEKLKGCSMIIARFLIPKMFHAEINASKSYVEIYKMIPLDNFYWNERKKKVWDRVISYSLSVRNQLKRHGTDEGSELLKSFTHFILLANQELYYNKPKASRSENKVRRNIEVIGNATPRKLIRTVGRTKMTSEKSPKLPTKESVIHYKTAVWTARGGVRRMKNGKLVPFKESVHHRKCLLEQKEDSVPQATIKMKKNNKI